MCVFVTVLLIFCRVARCDRTKGFAVVGQCIILTRNQQWSYRRCVEGNARVPTHAYWSDPFTNPACSLHAVKRQKMMTMTDDNDD